MCSANELLKYLVSSEVTNRCANELLQYLVSRGVSNRCANDLLQYLVSRGVSNRCANELLQYLVSRGLLLRGQPVSEQFLPDDQRSYCCTVFLVNLLVATKVLMFLN